LALYGGIAIGILPYLKPKHSNYCLKVDQAASLIDLAKQ
jgi:hypothetical protein